jgi:hypothetical protein
LHKRQIRRAAALKAARLIPIAGAGSATGQWLEFIVVTRAVITRSVVTQGGIAMSADHPKKSPNGFFISLDAWAVIVALLLALAVRLDLLKNISW